MMKSISPEPPPAATAAPPNTSITILEHPIGAPPGGLFYVQSSRDIQARCGTLHSYYCADNTPGKTIELWNVQTNEIVPLQPHQRIIYAIHSNSDNNHPSNSNNPSVECYDVHGTRIENVWDTPPAGESSSNSNNNNNSSTIEPLGLEFRVVRPTPRHRPNGTLAGGTWYQQTLQEETSFGRKQKRLLYREEHRYYTEAGLQVYPAASSLIYLGRDESLGSVANTPTEDRDASAVSKVNVHRTQGPVGAKPGGRWYKQTFQGPTNTAKYGTHFPHFLCCGAVPAFLSSHLEGEERYVYEEPAPTTTGTEQQQRQKKRYVDIHGRFADPQRGPVTPMPEGFDPMKLLLG